MEEELTNLVRTPYFKDASLKRGTHVLHFGGEYESHLLVPKV